VVNENNISDFYPSDFNIEELFIEKALKLGPQKQYEYKGTLTFNKQT